MEITTLTRLDARYPILILPFCEFCFSFPFHFPVKNYSSFEHDLRRYIVGRIYAEFVSNCALLG